MQALTDLKTGHYTRGSQRVQPHGGNSTEARW